MRVHDAGSVRGRPLSSDDPNIGIVFRAKSEKPAGVSRINRNRRGSRIPSPAGIYIRRRRDHWRIGGRARASCRASFLPLVDVVVVVGTRRVGTTSGVAATRNNVVVVVVLVQRGNVADAGVNGCVCACVRLRVRHVIRERVLNREKYATPVRVRITAASCGSLRGRPTNRPTRRPVPFHERPDARVRDASNPPDLPIRTARAGFSGWSPTLRCRRNAFFLHTRMKPAPNSTLRYITRGRTVRCINDVMYANARWSAQFL